MPTSLLKTLFWGLRKENLEEPHERAQQNGTFRVNAVLVEMARKRAQNLLPALLKLPCANWGTKPPFYTFDTLFWTLFLTSEQNVDL